jgi:LAO/AO transport system kinase
MIILMKTLEQNEYWMLEAINEQWRVIFITIPKYKTFVQIKAVQNGEISPFAAAQLILEKYFKKTYLLCHLDLHSSIY